MPTYHPRLHWFSYSWFCWVGGITQDVFLCLVSVFHLHGGHADHWNGSGRFSSSVFRRSVLILLVSPFHWGSICDLKLKKVLWTHCARTICFTQEQTPIHQSACPSHQRSLQAADLGLTSALFATRMRWTPSSTLAGTCVCVTPVASNSRKCPTPAVLSAEDRSKTLSRRTAARKGGPPRQQQVRVQKRELCFFYRSINID